MSTFIAAQPGWNAIVIDRDNGGIETLPVVAWQAEHTLLIPVCAGNTPPSYPMPIDNEIFVCLLAPGEVIDQGLLEMAAEQEKEIRDERGDG